FGRLGGSLYIAMEHVDGADLGVVLRACRQRGAGVPVAVAFRIAIEMLGGLEFAHRRGIVHRDVWPANILLSRAGEGKGADFGIAVAQGANGSRTIAGKWPYMSPEQSAGLPL